MSRLRVLVLAPECNPGCLTNPSIGYYEGQALARIHEWRLQNSIACCVIEIYE